MNLLFPATADLTARATQEGPEAYDTMTPGQILRVEYAVVLRQLAAALRADPSGRAALDLYGMLESALEHRVTALVHREVARIGADQYDLGARHERARWVEDGE